MTSKASLPLMGTVKYKKESNFRKVLNDSLNVFLKDALRVTLKDPKQAYYFFQTVKWQRKAARVRSKLEREDIHIPPIMIFSITNRCNLHCKGCYHLALNRSSRPEMSVNKIQSIITEAKELGISFMVIAGGEPLVRKEFLDITRDFPEIIFLVFTNGMLIDDDLIVKLKGQRNFIPVISLEGWQEDTDGRRGEGVYEHLQRIIEKLKGIGLFWSVSLTVTRSNFTTIVDQQFIKFLIDLGCKLFFFVEYTPLKEGTEDWVITDDQRTNLLTLRDSFRSKYSALFIAVPGDEDEIGGCLSAGRGFIHVSAEGDIEPCPFIPYSDTNLVDLPLKDALQSEFLKTIRQNHEQLSETDGGCALWVERDWVRSLLQKK
ncbi:MAG TPA: radical SAM protein [Dehalococcoidia bacterium]|jgi:MoaA/NifB/PqqE/SkfB family radical SAM enzyme|nr:radical SAM protein [Dehalococcoidia bacterium]